MVGSGDGRSVGNGVGKRVGEIIGELLGTLLGVLLGVLLGTLLGVLLGVMVGVLVGSSEPQMKISNEFALSSPVTAVKKSMRSVEQLVEADTSAVPQSELENDSRLPSSTHCDTVSALVPR